MKKIFLVLCIIVPMIVNAQSDFDTVDYQVQLKDYQNGKLSAQKLLPLILKTKDLKNDSLALRIAKDYKSQYLDKNDPANALIPEQCNFFAYYYSLFSVDDKWFKYLYKHSEKANLDLHVPNFSTWFVDKVITEHSIEPIIRNKGEYVKKDPDWSLIEKGLIRMYGSETSHRVVLMAKIKWYEKKQDWPNCIKYGLEQFEARGIATIGSDASRLNDFIYSVVFAHSEDRVVLSRCLGYMEDIVRNNPNTHTKIDTYACLLYKLGQKNKAIQIEESAFKLAETSNEVTSMNDYRDKLDRMRNNLPIWQ